jgi:membrane protein implicated in regulation of membrane protease activity
MRSFFSAVVAVLVLDGCASMGVNDGDRRFVGTVEQSQKTSRAGEPSGALMAFGAIGGLLHHAASGPTATNLYRVSVSGEIFTAQSDDEFAPGTCVEIIPAKDAFVGRAYAYGQARLVASDKCSGQTTSK